MQWHFDLILNSAYLLAALDPNALAHTVSVCHYTLHQLVKCTYQCNHSETFEAQICHLSMAEKHKQFLNEDRAKISLKTVYFL